MEPEYLLGIDLGTSSLKAVIVHKSGSLIALAGQEYEIEKPHTGWAEQDPEDWYRALTTAVRRVLSKSGLLPDAVAGVGFSGQMHGTVCLDEKGRLLRPAIIWADQRSREQVERLNRIIEKKNLGAWIGGPLAAGFMLPTLIWLREHDPDLARKIRHLLLPKDYLRWRLTDLIGSEPSDASSTGLFDPVHRQWSGPMIDFLKIDSSMLPPVYESAAQAGEITRKASLDTGLKAGTPVVFGGSDQSCQALAHGIIDPGSILCTIGTGGQLFASLDRPVIDPDLRLHLFCHALPDRWHQLAAILTAGLSLKWIRDLINPGESYQNLADSAAAVPAGSEGLIFLPYLVGERTPHMDPSARGAFIGLTLRHSKAHLVRAVMEGVVYALRQGLELMVESGVAVGSIHASGGAVVHPLWRELLADIFQREIYLTEVSEASAVGAALLAGVGIGVFSDVQSVYKTWSRPEPAVVHPDPKRSELYKAFHGLYTGMYPAVKNVQILPKA
jgi:xylulokinase